MASSWFKTGFKYPLGAPANPWIWEMTRTLRHLSTRQYFWEYISGKEQLMYLFSLRQYFWVYISEKTPLIYSFSIRQYSWEYISEKTPILICRNRSSTKCRVLDGWGAWLCAENSNLDYTWVWNWSETYKTPQPTTGRNPTVHAHPSVHPAIGLHFSIWFNYGRNSV